MMDDINTQEEHDSRLHKVLQRIQRSGLTLNKEKCFFSLPRLKGNFQSNYSRWKKIAHGIKFCTILLIGYLS